MSVPGVLGEHGGSLAIDILMVDRGAGIDEQFDYFHMSFGGGEHERRPVFMAVGGIYFRSVIEQKFNHRQIGSGRCVHEGSASCLIGGAKIGSRAHEDFSDIQVAIEGGEHERGPSGGVDAVRVGSIVQGELNDFGLSV